MKGRNKKAASEIGQKAFDLIVIANKLITGKSEDPKRDALTIRKGLHEIEFKAERLAERLPGKAGEQRGI